MALDYNLSDWVWTQGGEDWGFDPRMSDELLPEIERTAKNALTEDEKNTIVTTHAWKCVRKQRDNLLAETDWVGGTDVPAAIKTTWNTYRQALRDITTQTDPDNITWPTKPS